MGLPTFPSSPALRCCQSLLLVPYTCLCWPRAATALLLATGPAEVLLCCWKAAKQGTSSSPMLRYLHSVALVFCAQTEQFLS